MRHKKHIRDRRSPAYQQVKFYRHLRSYISVNALMLALTLFNGDGLFWLNVMFFWGIGLAAHYLSVFGLPGTQGMLSKDWEARMLGEGKRGTEEEPYFDLEKSKPRQKAWNDRDLV